MSGQVTIRVLTQDQRDAETGWDEGDLVYVSGSGLTAHDGQDWQAVGSGGDLPVFVADAGTGGNDGTTVSITGGDGQTQVVH